MMGGILGGATPSYSASDVLGGRVPGPNLGERVNVSASVSVGTGGSVVTVVLTMLAVLILIRIVGEVV